MTGFSIGPRVFRLRQTLGYQKYILDLLAKLKLQHTHTCNFYVVQFKSWKWSKIVAIIDSEIKYLFDFRDI